MLARVVSLALRNPWRRALISSGVVSFHRAPNLNNASSAEMRDWSANLGHWASRKSRWWATSGPALRGGEIPARACGEMVPDTLGEVDARFPWRQVSVRPQRRAGQEGREGVSLDGRSSAAGAAGDQTLLGTAEYAGLSRSAVPCSYDPSRKTPRRARLSGSGDRKVTKAGMSQTDIQG